MNKRRFVERFKAALNGGDTFAIRSDGGLKFVLVSDVCQIIFSFERFGSGFTILLSQPNSPAKEYMSFFLLRFLLGAKGDTSENSPESFSEIFNKYFQEIIFGEFSIKSQYDEIKDLFFDLLLKARKLPDSDPVKEKIKSFDISWIDDFRKRRS